MKHCTRCGSLMDDKDAFCGKCGQRASSTPPPFEGGAQSGSGYGQQKSKTNSTIIDSINDYMGNSRPVDLNWKDLFTDVFKKHTTEEAEDIFICGTARTTPDILHVQSTWPRPWLYSRVFLMFLLAFVLLRICADFFQNFNAVPGLIVVGAFTVPLTTLVLFMEVNAYRNISFYYVAKTFLVGGCASLVATLLLFELAPVGDLDFFGACMVGVIEEIGKLVIVYIFISRNPKCKHILSGLLIGASVGAGFAAFESAGYAMRILLMGGWDMMIDNIFLRGFLAPGGHVTWAAISGAALIIAKGNSALSPNTLFTGRFLRLFLIPVVLHSVWDMPIAFGSEVFLMPLLLTVAVWIVVLILINMGLDEVKLRKIR